MQVCMHMSSKAKCARECAHTHARVNQAVKEDTKHVWLTICGNDAKNHMIGCGAKCVPKVSSHGAIARSVSHAMRCQVVQGCLADSAKFLEPMWEAYPQVNVVQFGS